MDQVPRRRNAQRHNAVGIRRCVETRYGDDCLGNEAIRFGKSGLNGLIILKVLSKIIKAKIWLKIWSVFQDWGGQPQKRGKRNWHMISHFAHAIEAVPYTWQCILWCHSATHSDLRWYHGLISWHFWRCSRPPAQYLHKADWEWIDSQMKEMLHAPTRSPVVIFETPKAVLLTITDATEDQNVLGFGQSMVFVGLHLALCSLAMGTVELDVQMQASDTIPPRMKLQWWSCSRGLET